MQLCCDIFIVSAFWSHLLFGLVFLFACGNPRVDSSERSSPTAANARRESAKHGSVAKVPFEVRGNCDGFLLTWFDEEGPHSAMGRDEIPVEHRRLVRVSSPKVGPVAGTGVFVADLRNADASGRYPVRSMSRDALDRAVDQVMGVGDVADAAPVVVYGATWCGACNATRAHLKKRGVPFVDKDIEKDPLAREEMQAKARAAGVPAAGIPVIDFRGTVLTGFDANRLDQLAGL